MKRLIIGILLALVSTVYAANSITFTQDGVDVTSVAVGSPYQINGDTNVKNGPVFLCLEELPQNVCYGVNTDNHGDFSLRSSIDRCNFELHEEYVGGSTPTTTIICDTIPKKVTFMIIRPGTGKPILATADLTFE